MKTDDETWDGEWVETLIDKHPWLRTVKDEVTGGSPPSRWFVPRGRRWPLLCLTVYSRYPIPPVGVRISVSRKDAADAWFTDCNLPISLLPMMIESLSDIGKDSR